MKQKRKKGFLGALIGGGISLLGGIGSALINKNAQEKAMARQQRAQNRADTYEMANNLTAAYANQDYADEFAKKVTFKNGGVKRYSDRIKRNKKFSCGGRKKANLGTDVTSALIGAIGTIGSSAIQNSTNNNPIEKTPSLTATPKTEIKAPDYQQMNHPNSDSNVKDNYVLANILNNPRMFKCGGKRKTK